MKITAKSLLKEVRELKKVAHFPGHPDPAAMFEPPLPWWHTANHPEVQHAFKFVKYSLQQFLKKSDLDYLRIKEKDYIDAGFPGSGSKGYTTMVYLHDTLIDESVEFYIGDWVVDDDFAFIYAGEAGDELAKFKFRGDIRKDVNNALKGINKFIDNELYEWIELRRAVHNK